MRPRALRCLKQTPLHCVRGAYTAGPQHRQRNTRGWWGCNIRHFEGRREASATGLNSWLIELVARNAYVHGRITAEQFAVASRWTEQWWHSDEAACSGRDAWSIARGVCIMRWARRVVYRTQSTAYETVRCVVGAGGSYAGFQLGTVCGFGLVCGT